MTMLNERFGRLTVIAKASGRIPKRSYWLCRCDCGTESIKMGKYLRNGDTQSCGCAQTEYRAAGHVIHGGAKRKSSGRLSTEYVSWRDAKERCYNPNKRTFALYGGRGIRMCDRWRDDFATFLADMGPKPAGMSLDRIDVNGNYEPSNCRWATQQQQCNNQRRNKVVTFKGQKFTIAELARTTGIHYLSLYDRMRQHHETPEQAVEHLRRFPRKPRQRSQAL